jgi:hypothetical protein
MTTFLSERGFHVGYALMLLGVGILVSGFGIDAYLHADDPNLAAEEGVFTLSNPGHLLVAIGLCTTLLGAALGPYSRWVLPGKSPMLAMFVPAVAVGAALAASTAFSLELNDLSHEGDSHSHTAVAGEAHTEAEMDDVTGSHIDPATGATAESDAGHHSLENVLPIHRGTVALVEATARMPEDTAVVKAENLAFAEKFLADARAATEKYRDVSVAMADGYFQITPDLPLIGAHFFHEGYDGLDPAKPANLLYTDDGNGGWRLAGMSYQVPKTLGDDTPPVSGFGGLAQWHYHFNLCFLGGGQVVTAPNEDSCPGAFVPETGWLLHVWAWIDSPEGVFDHANSLLQ